MMSAVGTLLMPSRRAVGDGVSSLRVKYLDLKLNVLFSILFSSKVWWIWCWGKDRKTAGRRVSAQ